MTPKLLLQNLASLAADQPLTYGPAIRVFDSKPQPDPHPVCTAILWWLGLMLRCCLLPIRRNHDPR
jgi:hypothetical protein